MKNYEDRVTEFHRTAHKLAIGCAALHLLLCLGIAWFTGTWLLAIAVGLPAVLVPALLAYRQTNAVLSRVAMAVGYMSLTGLVIQQTGGDLEAHFSFFVMMSVLVVYCDWRAIVAAYVAIAVHHVGFTILQPLELGFKVWNDTRWSWGHFFVHGLVGAFQAAALCYLSVIQRQRVFDSFSVSEIAERVSRGELTAQDASSQSGDSEMLQAMNSMRSRLADMIGSVKATAQEIGVALGEITQGSTDLASRTEASASRTQQTTHELLGFVQRARHTLEVTGEVEMMSTEVTRNVESTNRTMTDLLQEMRGINGNARRIAEIIAVIDGMAFQTNLLALNAAVEAARAGQNGRGFAVVAGEVRSLAQRSAQAAKEIRLLIGEAVDRASRGSGLAEQTGAAMVSMVGAMTQVRTMVVEAAGAARTDQAQLEVLAETLKEIDRSMQGNAAFVEELNATTLALREQESGLREAVEAFVAPSATAGRPADVYAPA